MLLQLGHNKWENKAPEALAAATMSSKDFQ